MIYAVEDIFMFMSLKKQQQQQTSNNNKIH